MKIRQLDLLAFGPFTGLSLTFDAAHHGLYLICGPNEAGKSSALRALHQLLFGIEDQTSDNFVHAYPNLRIGARLENSAGDNLDCIRRKGRKNTLRGLDDEVIDPARLREMIGGIDEATFRQRFGIDYEELRQGGAAVVQGGGDLGAMLFTAGSGMSDLGQVKKRLADEADELFKPRGSNQQINKAIKELGEARRQIKDSQLLTSEWVKHDKALRQATTRVAEIDEQLLALKSKQSRLERIDEALPLIARRQQLREQLAEVADAALLPADFSGSRRESTAELANAQQALTGAEKAIAKLRSAMREINVPEALLAHRTAIATLHTELGSFQKAAKDRPGLVARREQAEQQAQSILRELGRELHLDDAEELRITRAQRQKIQSLAGDCKALLSKQETTGRALRDLRDETKQLESQLSEIAAPREASELNRAIRRVQKLGDLDQQLDDARGSLRQLEHDAEIDLRKLRLWNGTLDELERLPVPASETVDRFGNELADASSAVAATEQRIDDSRTRLQQLDQKLETLRLEQDVPTEVDLSRARAQRDAGWQLVLQTWWDVAPDDDAVPHDLDHEPKALATSGQERVTSNPELSEFIAQFAPGGDLAQAFQSSVEAADQVSDRLRREADRVAEKAKLTADRQELTLRLEKQQEEFSRTQDALARLQSQWRDEWSALKIEPLPPREMHSWLNQQLALTAAAALLRKQRGSVESLENLIRSHRSALNQSLAELRQPAANDNETLAALLGRCEDVAAEIETAIRHRQDVEKNLRKLRSKLASSEQEAELASSAVDRWRTDWAAVVEQLGLDRDAEPHAANSVIDSVDELFSHLKVVDDTRVRIEGIDRDAGQFAKSVTHLLSQVATDLQDMPVDQAVADLNDRLEAARTAKTKLGGWNEQLQQEEGKLATANSQALHWRATLASLCREAGCATPDELPEAERKSAVRQKLEDDLRGLNEQLVALAGGAALDDFITEAIQHDTDEVKAKIDSLGDEIRQFEKEKSDVSETIGSERNELRRMDGSGQAAAAREHVEHLLARIRGDAEQYIRLRIASAVLRKSIERFREQSQGPVMQRASDLFGELTLGSFSGLRADYNDKGDAVLVGVRPDGQQTVGVGGMSEGTCDQLYLALRLALLESYLAHNEPIPFIVDDILIMFDDDRAVAALKALARLSEHTQVIFFTHHEHVVELARENLDHDVLCTYTLDHRQAVIAQASGTPS